jgi:Tol biopolymer transport system component
MLLAALTGCLEPPPAPPPPRSPDPSPSPPLTRVSPPQSTDAELTRDGQWLFFATRAFGEHYDLYRKQPHGETVTLVLGSPADERFPAIGPDGRSLAFCSDLEGTPAVYVIPDFMQPPPAEEWSRYRISRSGESALHPTWAPDGSRIAYCATAGDDWSDARIVLYERETQSTHRLGVTGLLPRWAPNGERIVFQRMRGRDAHLGGLWIARLKGLEVESLTRIFDLPNVAAINPCWSPDGARVVFAVTASADAEATPQARDLGIVADDGTQPWWITQDEAPDWLPIWPVADTIYFVSERDGAPAIWTVAVPSSEPAKAVNP